MRRFYLLFFWLFFGWIASVSELASEPYDPVSLYLTWQRDPTTTMTIQWISKLDRKASKIEYQQTGEEKWQEISGLSRQLPQKFPYLLHRVELLQLEPDCIYRFRIGPDAKIYTFKTMPKTLNTPIRFVVGGDIYHDGIDTLSITNTQAARTSPHFAIMGGDLAYASSRFSFMQEDGKRWLDWLINWKKQGVTPEGHLIPLVCAIGNHDVCGKFSQTPSQALFFYTLFAVPNTAGSYRTLDFGNYLSLIILDSGHTHPIMGQQTSWLAQALENRAQAFHKFAVYHVPAYPSARSWNHRMSSLIREHWVPLFERFGLTAAFEHHDHTYKRTHLLLKGRPDPAGVLYLGDGAWGVRNPRTPKTPKEREYLAKSVSARHFILVELKENERRFTALTPEGKEIDSVTSLRNPEKKLSTQPT